jgi:hypothetical protein
VLSPNGIEKNRERSSGFAALHAINSQELLLCGLKNQKFIIKNPAERNII